MSPKPTFAIRDSSFGFLSSFVIRHPSLTPDTPTRRLSLSHALTLLRDLRVSAVKFPLCVLLCSFVAIPFPTSRFKVQGSKFKVAVRLCLSPHSTFDVQ